MPSNTPIDPSGGANDRDDLDWSDDLTDGDLDGIGISIGEAVDSTEMKDEEKIEYDMDMQDASLDDGGMAM